MHAGEGASASRGKNYGNQESFGSAEWIASQENRVLVNVP